MWQKLNRCYPPTLELIPILLLVFTIYITFINYSALPERIPIDFNSQGIAEDWANKNMMFLYPGLGVFIYLLFTTLNIWFAVTKNPKSLINMPKKWKDSLSDSQTEELRVILNRYLFILKVVIQVLMLYLLYASIEVALGYQIPSEYLNANWKKLVDNKLLPITLSVWDEGDVYTLSSIGTCPSQKEVYGAIVIGEREIKEYQVVIQLVKVQDGQEYDYISPSSERYKTIS